jgi:hypothetical protein
MMLGLLSLVLAMSSAILLNNWSAFVSYVFVFVCLFCVLCLEVGSYKMFEKHIDREEDRGFILYLDNKLEATEIT